MDARQAAFTSLLKCSKACRYSNIELAGAIYKNDFSDRDKALFTALFYGVIEKSIALDYYISKISSRDIGDIDYSVLTAIRLGLYQMIYMDKIPESAAVDESVKLADRFKLKSGSSSFINAVLRNFIRQRDGISLPDREKDKEQYYSVTYSLPVWLINMYISAYGEENAEKIFITTLKNPPTVIRANTLKITRDELFDKLSADGFEPRKTAVSPNGITLRAPYELLKAYEGLFFVQDEASQICSLALGAKSGDTVLDVCSAPGGKSFGAALDMKNEGRIYSYDIHLNKLSLVRNTAKLLGIDIIAVSPRDGANDEAPLADKIICDVPCSGLGVISKKPDIRSKSPEDFSRLPEIQYSILENSARYLKEGGVLVYSTCTLNPAENTEVVSRFLANNPDFYAEGFRIGEHDFKGIGEIFPYTYGTDGFFIARLIKKQ